MDQTPYEMVIQAFERNEIGQMLKGENGYYTPEAYMAPSNVPTNWNELWIEGICPYLKKDVTKIKIFEDAMIQLTQTPLGLYCALAMARAMMFSELIANIDMAKIFDKIKKELPLIILGAKNEHYNWMGDTDEMLSDRIERLCNIIKLHHGINLLE